MRQFLEKQLAVMLVAMCFALLFALSRAAHAVPVLNTTEGLPSIDMAQRDSAGQVRSYVAQDDNSDGVISLIADLDPLSDGWVEVHIESGALEARSCSIRSLARPFTAPILSLFLSW